MEAARREAIRSMLAVAREAVPEVEPEPSDSALEAVSGALVELASHTALWPLEEFEAQLEAQSEPGSGTAAPSELWTQLAADADGRLALYLWLTRERLATVPHDHNPSWAVVAGIMGTEHNTIYAERPALHAVRQVAVTAGGSIAMRAGDVHSVALDGRDEPVLQLHLYGLSIDLLAGRKVFDADGRRAIVDGNAVPSLSDAFVLNETHTPAGKLEASAGGGGSSKL
jgi:hypothetical protein